MLTSAQISQAQETGSTATMLSNEGILTVRMFVAASLPVTEYMLSLSGRSHCRSNQSMHFNLQQEIK